MLRKIEGSVGKSFARAADTATLIFCDSPRLIALPDNAPMKPAAIDKGAHALRCPLATWVAKYTRAVREQLIQRRGNLFSSAQLGNAIRRPGGTARCA